MAAFCAVICSLSAVLIGPLALSDDRHKEVAPVVVVTVDKDAAVQENEPAAAA